MKDKNLNNDNLDNIENLEDFEREEDATSKSEDYVSDDVVFEELNAEGEEMSEKEKEKHHKDKLKEKFENKIKRLEKERDEYLAGWQRAQADYKNREKEIEEYKKDILKFANTNLIRDIIPVFDGYDMARNNKTLWESVDANWRVGVEYLFMQLEKVLESNGVQTFGEIGEVYDTAFHEAVEKIELDFTEKDNNGKILYVLQKGYKIENKILREAKVKVGYFEEK